MDLNQVISHLEDLVGGLKAHQVYVQHGERSVTLMPHATVAVELKARKKGDKESLSLKLKWEAEPEPVTESVGLTISSGPQE